MTIATGDLVRIFHATSGGSPWRISGGTVAWAWLEQCCAIVSPREREP